MDSIGSWGDGVDKQMNTTKWERSGLGGGEQRTKKQIILSLVGEEQRNRGTRGTRGNRRRFVEELELYPDSRPIAQFNGSMQKGL